MLTLTQEVGHEDGVHGHGQLFLRSAAISCDQLGLQKQKIAPESDRISLNRSESLVSLVIKSWDG
jgi:hypothetical protein